MLNIRLCCNIKNLSNKNLLKKKETKVASKMASKEFFVNFLIFHRSLFTMIH